MDKEIKKVKPTEPYGDVNIEMLKEFSEADGICGHEKGASRVMKKYVEKVADEIIYDNLGSMAALKKGTGNGPKVAGWLRFYMTYILPLIVLAIFVIGLVNFFGN